MDKFLINLCKSNGFILKDTNSSRTKSRQCFFNSMKGHQNIKINALQEEKS